MSELQEWLAVAAQLRTRVPFLSEALNLIPIVESNLVDLAEVDDRSIMINTKRFAELQATALDTYGIWFPTPSAAKAAILIHECMHLVLKSKEREQWRDHDRFNLAADYAINLLLVDLFRFPPFSYTGDKLQRFEDALSAIAYYDRAYRNMSAEQIYDALGDRPVPKKHNIFGNDFGRAIPISGVPDNIARLLDTKLADYLERNSGLFSSKGCQASTELKEAGKKPPILLSHVLRKIRDVLPGYEYSYQYPSRLDAFGPLFGFEGRMPSLHEAPSDKVRQFVVAVDASSSFNLEEKQTALSLVRESLRFVHRKVLFLVFTDRIVQAEELTVHSTISINYTGATKISSVIDYVDEHRLQPSVVMICTDGLDVHAYDRFSKWRFLNRCRTIIIRNPAARFPGMVFHCDVCR